MDNYVLDVYRIYVYFRKAKNWCVRKL